MKKIFFTSYFLIILFLVAGCSLPFLPQSEEDISSEPVKTYEVQGTVLEKSEEEVIVATTVVTGKVKASDKQLSELNIGDTVRVLVTSNEIITIFEEEASKNDFKIATDGFDYETLGYIGDKFQKDDSYVLQIAGDMISGNINVSGDVFREMEIGQQVKIFANLDGIQAVAALPKQNESNENDNEGILTGSNLTK
ncbi:MAG: hypothetical protein JG764_880 [Clostridiales bacterium]|jgi:hypothetical protein|nr:hypothetical protein [Clostridiales bacterium]